VVLTDFGRFCCRKILVLFCFLLSLGQRVLSKEKLFESITPRYFALLTFSSCFPWMLLVELIMFLLFVTLRTKDLSGWNCIDHFFSYATSLLRSLWSCLEFSEEVIRLYRYTTSANRAIYQINIKCVFNQ